MSPAGRPGFPAHPERERRRESQGGRRAGGICGPSWDRLDWVGSGNTVVTETVYRKQIRPVMQGARPRRTL